MQAGKKRRGRGRLRKAATQALGKGGEAVEGERRVGEEAVAERGSRISSSGGTPALRAPTRAGKAGPVHGAARPRRCDYLNEAGCKTLVSARAFASASGDVEEGEG